MNPLILWYLPVMTIYPVWKISFGFKEDTINRFVHDHGILKQPAICCSDQDHVYNQWQKDVQTCIYKQTSFKLFLDVLYQTTENYSSTKHQCCAFLDIKRTLKAVTVTLILCIFGYSRTLITVLVQKIKLWYYLFTYKTLNTVPVHQWLLHYIATGV